jgi:hypothetical protein
MQPATEPDQIDHSALRELAMAAAWVANLSNAIDALEDLVGDSDDDAAAEGGNPEDPLFIALSVVEERWEDEDRELERRLTTWLAEDPEHWPIFRLVVLEPWQERPGVWIAGVPDWVRALATDAILAHFQHDPYGRRAQLDLDR